MQPRSIKIQFIWVEKCWNKQRFRPSNLIQTRHAFQCSGVSSNCGLNVYKTYTPLRSEKPARYLNICPNGLMAVNGLWLTIWSEWMSQPSCGFPFTAWQDACGNSHQHNTKWSRNIHFSCGRSLWTRWMATVDLWLCTVELSGLVVFICFLRSLNPLLHLPRERMLKLCEKSNFHFRD